MAGSAPRSLFASLKVLSGWSMTTGTRSARPNASRCLRLVRARAVETHENWLEQHRCLNMDDLHEHKKEALRRAA
jgi:hypothetical protein